MKETAMTRTPGSHEASEELRKTVAMSEERHKLLAAELKAGQEEMDRMRTALQYIADRPWAATTLEPAKWIKDFCDVAAAALAPATGHEGGA
jgi:hypothetical protein